MTRPSIFYLLTSLLLLGAGCRTSQPLTAIDLAQPGWRVAQGQAVWQPPGSRPEIAGDLVVATNTNGNYLVQFTKNPFAIVMAEVQDDRWEIRFGGDKQFWNGKGRPPTRFPWFQLPAAMGDRPLNRDWKFERLSGNLWRLQNPRTGEMLAGEFFP